MSLTIVSLAIGLVILVAQYVGVTFTGDELQAWFSTTGKLVSTVGLVVTQLVAWYGRVRAGDVSWTGKRQ